MEITLPSPRGIRGFRADRCPDCALPGRTCICAAAPRLFPATRFLILRHPAESSRATNTARLLQACLPETLILAWTGKQTAPAGFAQALAAERTTPFLLFPGAGVSAEEAHQRAGGTGRSPLFILLDGSWRQARKMRGTASWLHGIPTASLDVGPSLSRLRRQHRSGNLSTVEAAHAALQAGGETETAGELLLHFLRFQDAWSLLRPYAVRLGERPDDA